MFKRTRHPAWMFLCLATLALFSALSALAQAATANAAGTNAAVPQLPIVAVQRVHTMPVQDPNSAAVAPAAPVGAHLSYFGGPVISNVHVVQVLYGSGSY